MHLAIEHDLYHLHFTSFHIFHDLRFEEYLLARYIFLRTAFLVLAFLNLANPKI
jgi:hypothetical protein